MENEFEYGVHLACTVLGVPVELYRPKDGGRDMVFYRDIDMVSDADLVVCIFHEDAPMEGGTAHVVEKAQDRRVPVYTYTFDSATSELVRLGEWDPDDAWGSKVPAG